LRLAVAAGNNKKAAGEVSLAARRTWRLLSL